MERVEQIHDLPKDKKTCPNDGQPLKHIGEETSEQLLYIPAKLKVIKHKRYKYACGKCNKHIITADKPKDPIPKSIASKHKKKKGPKASPPPVSTPPARPPERSDNPVAAADGVEDALSDNFFGPEKNDFEGRWTLPIDFGVRQCFEWHAPQLLYFLTNWRPISSMLGVVRDRD